KLSAKRLHRPLLRIGLISSEHGFAKCQSIFTVPCHGWFMARTYSTKQHRRQSTPESTEEMLNGRLSGRIHITGMGNVGCFVAHALASRKTRPPITLLLHNKDMYAKWMRRKQSISLMTNGLDDIKTGYDVNVLDNNIWYSLPHSTDQDTLSDTYMELAPGSSLHGLEGYEELAPIPPEKDDEKIECLIVTTKAPQTVQALASVSNRLTPESTVLFLQNGMGVVEEVNEQVFPDPKNRPHYIQGIISHGLKGHQHYHIEYTGVGTVILGALPSQASPNLKEEDWAPSTKYLLRTLTLTPPLVAVAESPTNVLQYQLEKLAMNCVINSFTVLLDAQNGELLYNYHITRSMRLLLAEISTVICALPELEGVPGIQSRFATERLRKLAANLANKTAANTSSMLQDMQSLRRTEIEYINGYIVRRGDELGIKCALNYMLMQLVLGKNYILRQREAGAVPFDLSNLETEEEQ
ncbi:putative 2-dehydropantoate 2-reductase, partial [Talaromyces proteolyticus]